MNPKAGSARSLAALALIVVVGTSACGFQARREEAEFVISTPERVHEMDTARISWTQELSSVEVTDSQSIQVFGLPFRVGGDLDLSDRRATAFVIGDQGPSPDLPLMVFDDNVLFLRKLSEDDATRPWVKFDFGELEEGEIDQPSIGFNALNPLVWVDLLGGTLTGSVEEVGDELIGDVQTTHYRVNVDREKAFEDVPDDRFETLEAMFVLLGAEEIVTPTEIWLDGDGLPRRFTYALEQRFDRTNVFRLDLSFEMSEFGTPTDVTIPGESETVEVESFHQLLTEFGADQFAQRLDEGVEGGQTGPAVPQDGGG